MHRCTSASTSPLSGLPALLLHENMGSVISMVSSIAGNQPRSTLEDRDSYLCLIYQPQLHLSKAKGHTSLHHIWDVANVAPRISPPYSEKQSAVELWRKHVSEQIDRRIAAYRIGEQIPTHVASGGRSCRHSEHRVFHIPELLDLILQFAGPEAQMRVLLVSTAWRSSTISVVSHPKNREGFRSVPFCAPVGYATRIGENCGPMQEYSTE